MKKAWVVAIVGMVMCGNIHMGNTQEFPPAGQQAGAARTGMGEVGTALMPKGSIFTQGYCDAAKTVLSATKSKVAFDAFLASIGKQCDPFISNFKCKVLLANSIYAPLSEVNICVAAVMDEKSKEQKKATDRLAKTESRDPNNYKAPETLKVPTTIDTKVSRQPQINSADIQLMLIQPELNKQKQYCEAAKTLLSSTKSKEGFDALHAEIGSKCESFIAGFWCVVHAANPSFAIDKFDCRG